MENLAKFIGWLVMFIIFMSAIYAFIGWTVEPIWVHANWAAVRGCITLVIGAVILLYVVVNAIDS